MSFPGVGPLPLYGFQRPGMLLFGLIPLALLAVYVVVQARRRQRLHRFTEADVPQSLWRHIPIAVALLSLFLLTIALATPTHDMRIPRNRACVVLIIDMSNSMRATDVEPNRLKAAEQAASQFASQLTPGINLGLVGFAGTPYLILTSIIIIGAYLVVAAPTMARGNWRPAGPLVVVADRRVGWFGVVLGVALVGAHVVFH